MVSRQDIDLPSGANIAVDAVEHAVESAVNDHPVIYLPDASFLLEGQFEKVGFDLVITNPNGATFVVADYFSYIPPPNLMLPSGAGLSPELVMAKLHLPFGEDVMFAGPAASANALVEVGKVTLAIGKITVKRMGPDGQIEELDVKRGDKLYKGDELSTEGGSFVKARMIDGTRFHLGKNANAILSDYAFDETAKTGNFEAYVIRGGFHYKSGKIGKMFAGLNKSHSTISTPSATIGIRGSELDGNVDELGNTTIVHRSGILAITDINGQNEVVLDTPGNTSIITFSGIPAKYEAPSPEHIETLNQNLPPPDTPEELQDDGDEPPADETKEETAAEDEDREDQPSEEETKEETTDETREEEPAEEEPTEEEPSAEVEPTEEEPSAEVEPSADEERVASTEGQNEVQDEDGQGQGQGQGGQQPDGENSSTRTDGEAQSPQSQSGQSTSNPDTPDGVTIRESEFGDPNAGIVDATENLITGSDGTRPGEGLTEGEQADAGSELEILDVPSNEEKEPEGDLEEDRPEQKAEELPPDNPPIARDDFLGVSEPGAQDITSLLLSNDNDGDEGQAPRIAQVESSGELGGRVEFNGTTAVYFPNESALDGLRGDETATETFRYRVVSGDLTDTATLTVRLVGTNLSPIATDDAASAIEDQPITINVLDNDKDPDGDDLIIAAVDAETARGSVGVSADGKQLLYSPPDDLPAGVVANDVFSYQVSDGQFTDTATITISVTGKNDAPAIITVDEPFEVTAGGGATSIPLSAIFTDADLGDELVVVSVDTAGTIGSVTIGSIIYDDKGAFRYLAEGEMAFDSFGVTARDQFGAQGSGTYTVKIIGVNDPPEPGADAYTVLAGEPFSPSSAAGGLLANDVDIDNGAVLRVDTKPVSEPANGTLTLQPNGQFTYVADDGFIGIDGFVYQVIDEYGSAQQATVVLNVTGSNTPPVTSPDSFVVSKDGSVTGNVLSNDIDPEGLALTASIVALPTSGTVTLGPGGAFEYQPGDGFTGLDSFVYVATDPLGGKTEEQVSINVVAENLPPEVINITDQMIPAGQVSSIDLASYFLDPEGTELVYDFSSPAGFLSITGSVLSALPPAVAVGESINVVVGASDGENVVTQSVTLTVADPNLPPEVVNPIPNQGIFTNNPVSVDVSSRFDDPDGDALTYFLVTGASFLTLTGNTLAGTPLNGDEGTYSVTIGADDGLATTTTTFTLLVSAAPLNNPTTVLGGSNQHTDTNTSTIVSTGSTLLVSDIEGLSASPFSINSQGTNGTATIDPSSGAFVYTPTVNTFTGFDTFTVDVVDAVGVSTTIPVNIIIRPTDLPAVVVSGDTGVGAEDASVLGSLVVSEDDPIGPTPFSINPANPGTFGSAVINPGTGDWLYTPDPEYAGTDTFEVIYTDAYNYTTTFVLTVGVSPDNDQVPVVSNDSFTVMEGAGASEADLDSGNANLLVGASDADLPGDTLTVVPSSGATAHGTVTVNADGTFTYTHDDSETLTDTFTFQVTDGVNTSPPATVNITVTPVNDNAPVADNEDVSVGQGGVATEANLLAGLTLLDGDTDADGDTLNTIAFSGATTNGSVVINTDGTFSYTHDGSSNFTDSFTYQVTDGTMTDIGTVMVTVAPTPNSPAGGVVITGNPEFGNSLTAVTGGITDADGTTGALYSYEWFADGVSVSGPSTASSTYTTTITDVGKELRVDVTFTDDAGNAELVSDSTLVTPQDPNVSNTQTYTLVPSFGEFVQGSLGNDTITLVGAAESDDLIDLDDGVDILNLDDVVNNLFVEGVETLVGGSMTDTVTLEGDLNSLTGIITNPAGPTAIETIINGGFIQIFDGTTVATNGDFQNNMFGYLELRGSVGSDITFETFSSQFGNIFLNGGSGGSSITVNTGGLTNQGFFQSGDAIGGSAPNEFTGLFVNGGAGNLVVGHDLTFTPGSTLDVRDGNISLLSSSILRINAATLMVDITPINGDSSAIVLFDGASTLNITGSYGINGGGPIHDFAGAVNVTGGMLIVGPGANLELTGDDIDANLMNSGKIVVKSGTTSLDGGFSQTASGELIIDSNTISGAAGINDTTGFINNSGVIELDNSDGSAFVSTLTVNTLTNSSGGLIVSLDDDLSLAGGSHIIDATLNNNGKVEVWANLDLTRVGANHANDGEIELLDGATLFVTGASSFTNQMSKRITGDGTINSNVAVLNMGILEPQGLLPGGVDLAFTGALNLSGTGTVTLDIYSADHDRIDVGGQLNADGNIHLNFISTANVIAGGTIHDIISYGSLGVDNGLTVTHNLGPGYGVTVVLDGGMNHYDIVVTAPTFDNGAIANGDWSSGATWSGAVPDGGTENVQISTFDVTHTAAATNSVNSLIVSNFGSLDISNGTVELLQLSRVDGNSDLDLNLNGVSTGSLKIENELIIEGTMTWNNGGIDSTTTGFLNVLGTLDLTPGPGTTVDANIENNGIINIMGGGLILGTSPLNNNFDGEVYVTATTDLDLPINSSGYFSVGSAVNQVDVTHSQNINNTVDSLYTFQSPATFNTSVVLDNANFTNAGTLRFDPAGTGGFLFDLNANGHLLDNTGTIEVMRDATFDVEGALLDTAGGRIYVDSVANLNIDGGVSGGDFSIDGGTVLDGTGNLNFLGDVTVNVTGAAFLDSPLYIDTSGGDVTFAGSMLSIGGATVLELNSNDQVNTSNFQNFGTVRFVDNGIILSAPFENYGTLEVLGDLGTGLKTIDNAFNNQGNIILDIASTEQNILEVGAAGATAVLTNDMNGYIQSSQSGGAGSPNVFRGTLVNNGILQVDHDLDLNETGVPVLHENYNEIWITSGQTLTLGANNDLGSVYDPESGQFGAIKGGGTLDVSAAGVEFKNEGLIMPGGYGMTDILTIAGNASTEFTDGTVVEIELNGNTPGTGHDQLVFTGTTPALNGRLKINALSAPSGSYNIIASTGLGVIFSLIEGTDLYATDSVVLDVTKGATNLTLTVVTPTVGTAGSDGTGTFVTTAGGDTIHGLDGDDEIANISTGDTVFGGHGNDKVTTDLNFKRIVGGDGIDTVQFTDATVNLTTVEGYRLEEIEAISVEGNGPQLVTLDAAAIRNISDEENDLGFNDSALVVFGDSSDHLVLIGDYVPIGSEVFDVRGAGAEEFIELEQTSTMTGTTSVFIDDQMLVEVQRTGGAKDYFGSAGDDVIDDVGSAAPIKSTNNNDSIDGRDGNDFLDGGLGNDLISGGDGNDTIVYDVADTGFIDGGDGIDTLIDSTPGATINLTGVANLLNFEKIDIMDGNADTLNLDLVGLGNLIGDNALDGILPLNPGREKMVITGDPTDVVNLAGTNLNDITGGIIGGGAFTSDFVESNYLGDGQMYIRITDGATLDLYVHANLVDDNPIA